MIRGDKNRGGRECGCLRREWVITGMVFRIILRVFERYGEDGTGIIKNRDKRSSLTRLESST